MLLCIKNHKDNEQQQKKLMKKKVENFKFKWSISVDYLISICFVIIVKTENKSYERKGAYNMNIKSVNN